MLGKKRGFKNKLGITSFLKSSFFKKNTELIFVMGILTIFLLCSLFYISLPGLGRDESFIPLSALKILVQNDFSLFKLLKSVSFSTLMLDYQHCALFAFLYDFAFYIFSANIYTVRLISVFFNLVFLLFFYFFIKNFLDQRTAMFALILVSTVPVLIFYMRTTLLYCFPLLLIFSCLFFFWKFYNQGKSKHLYASCLILGIGFSFTLIFWWYFFALIITFLLIYHDFRFKKKELLIGFLFFMFGASPIFLWNLSVSFEQNIINSVLIHTQDLPFSKSSEVFSDPLLRIEKIGMWDKLIFKSNQIHSVLGNMIGWWFFIIALIFSFIATIFGLVKKEKKKVLFILVFMIILFFESVFLGWNLEKHQILGLIPLGIILLSVLLNYIYRHSKILAWFLLILIAASNLLIFIGNFNDFTSGLYFDTVMSYRGINSPTDFPSGNIYSLADYLEENKLYRPVVIGRQGFEIRPAISFLTNLKVKPIDLIEELGYDESKLAEDLKKEFLDFDNTFIISDSDALSILGLVEIVAKDLDKTIMINKTFYFKNGEIEYILFRVE